MSVPRTVQTFTPVQRLMRRFIFWLVRLYYPRIEVQGVEKIPFDKPIIFVLNHPNGLLDPIVLMLALGCQAAFLAKSTLFAYPLINLLVNAFGALPVFRQRDVGSLGGPSGNIKQSNAETFARGRALLHAGGAIALFPEGTTHSDPQLRALRTGAARIALSTEAEADWTAGVHVVPIGLWYEDKARFRSGVVLAVGEPFGLQTYADAYEAEPRRAVRALTDRIQAALDTVVVQAETSELLAAAPLIAAWTAPNMNLIKRREWAAKLLRAYRHLNHTDPERLERFAAEARRYARTLNSLGVRDPWQLEMPELTQGRPLRLVLFIIAASPLALAGLFLSYLPYRLIRPVAHWITRYDIAVRSTIKLLGGLVLMLFEWVLAAVLVSVWLGMVWGWALFLASPFLGYVALLWGEAFREWRRLSAYSWLRLRHDALVRALKARREALAAQIVELIQAVPHV